MSTPLIAIVAIVYGYVAIEYLLTGRYGLALAWAAYAVANLGFIIDGIMRK